MEIIKFVSHMIDSSIALSFKIKTKSLTPKNKFVTESPNLEISSQKGFLLCRDRLNLSKD